jgi:single-strand DNA-binding protein
MSIGYLKTQAIGNLGKDPEVSTASSGVKVARFSLAVNRKRKEQETVTWINVVTFDKLAEVVSQYCRKGQAVFVEGDLQVKQFDRQDGTKGTSVDVLANQVVFLEKKRDAEPQSSNSTSGDGGISDEDIPF